MRPNFAGIPDELKAWPQWIVWRDVNNTKLPFDPKTANMASVTDPTTWAGFDYCTQAYMMFPEYYSGIGFVLTKNDPYVLLDGDYKNIEDADIIAKINSVGEMYDSYMETSYSGKGFHVIAKGVLPSGRRGHGFELYPHERFMVMTGHSVHNPPKPIVERQNMLLEMFERMHADKKNKLNGQSYVNAQYHNEQLLYEDHAIYQKCAASPTFGTRFIELYEGRWEQFKDAYPSQSEADQALTNYFAVFTRNREQIKRMFLASALGQRDKARKRPDYIAMNITTAFDNIPDPIELERVKTMFATLHSEPQKRTPPELAGGVGSYSTTIGGENGAVPKTATTTGEPVVYNDPDVRVQEAMPQVNSILFPTGLMGDIAQFIYNAAPKPLPEAALCGAIGLMAGICGRVFTTYTGAGLNMYVLCIGLTGAGKEGMRNGISRIVRAVTSAVPRRGNQPIASINENIELADIQSYQALMKVVAVKPCCVAITGEFGMFLKTVTSDGAPMHLVGMLRKLLELFSLSGMDSETGGLVYSDKTQNVANIQGTAFSLLGETTPSTYYQAISPDLVAKGLIPRFLSLESTKRSPVYNENAAYVQVPQALIDKLGEYVVNCHSLAQRQAVTRVVCDDATRNLDNSFRLYCDSMMNAADLTDDATQGLWSRAHIKVMKLASLVAVGINPAFPTITPDIWDWAQKLVVADVLNVISHFEEGSIGPVTGYSGDQLKRRNKLLDVLADYMKKPYTELRTSVAISQGEQMHSQGLIPQTYLTNKLQAAKGFARQRETPSKLMFETLRMFEQEGVIEKLNAKDCGFTGKNSIVYRIIDLEIFKRRYQR